MRKLLFLLGSLLAGVVIGSLSVGCAHAQVTPTKAKTVFLTWTAPTNPACNATNPCTYDVSRIALPAGTATCPAVNVATPNYGPLNSANPVSTQAYPDTAATGLTACYTVQTVQGGQIGQPSNTAGPFIVPAVPGIPTQPDGTVADLKQPELPQPTQGPDAPSTVAMLAGNVR
jgi:hypothetical protein